MMLVLPWKKLTEVVKKMLDTLLTSRVNHVQEVVQQKAQNQLGVITVQAGVK